MQINEKPNEQAGELGEEQDGGGGSLGSGDSVH